MMKHNKFLNFEKNKKVLTLLSIFSFVVVSLGAYSLGANLSVDNFQFIPKASAYMEADCNDNNLWFATSAGGISKFDGTNWNIYNTSNTGMVTDRIKALFISN